MPSKKRGKTTDRDERFLLPECLGDYVDSENPVRVLDGFVEGLDLVELGFDIREEGGRGAPRYDEGMLLKLLVYGYLNKVRSSRALERECGRNLELIWLTCRNQPDHWTINDFRRRNRKAFDGVLRKFNRACVQAGLIGRELLAVDGSFFKADNSPSRNFTEAQIKRMERRVEEAISEFHNDMETQVLADADADADAEEATALPKELKQRKRQVRRLRKALENSPTGQVSLSDPDARLLRKGSSASVVGYNVQMAVDGQHGLIAHLAPGSSGSDQDQLAEVVERARDALSVADGSDIEVVADGGYHSGRQLAQCEASGSRVHSPSRRRRKSAQGAEETFPEGMFVHDPDTDEYICPEGARLRRHSDTVSGRTRYRIYYDTAACRECPVKESCTRGKYRKIRVGEYRDVEQAVAQRMRDTPSVYARRKHLAEAPFGTIKVGWGGSTLLLRGREGVAAELSLLALSYNWKRALKLLGGDGLGRMLAGIDPDDAGPCPKATAMGESASNSRPSSLRNLAQRFSNVIQVIFSAFFSPYQLQEPERSHPPPLLRSN